MQIINWKNIPFIRLLLPLIGGILAGIYCDLQDSLWLLPLLILVLLQVVIVYLIRRKPKLSLELLFGGITVLILLFAGINLVVYKTSKNKEDHYQKASPSAYEYIVEVTEMPKDKPNSIQIIGEVISVVDTNNIKHASSGLVLLYFKKDSLSQRILQGDILLCKSFLNDIKPPQNPGQFNYKQYLSFNQIYQQGFVKTNEWRLLETNNKSVISYASSIRDKLLNILKTHNLKDEELAVASALILGYKDDLGDELKHSYSSAGATHVLAVSGLHVGIIFMVLNFLLGILDKDEKFKITRLIFLLIALWFYATLTGLSPSVVRAAMMFSFVALGKCFQKSSSIYNTLGTSAFVLLVYNPYLIMEVGFQLSYLAVIGIVYFQQIIYSRIYVANKFGDYLWMITSVSIAAQLITFPLGLLYFHQFPTYFFISNLIVIPGAMVIIGIGLILFAFCWVPYLNTWIAKLLETTIWAMNSVVKSIDKLPYSLIEAIHISILECWLIYGVIIFGVLSRETRKLKFAAFSLMCFIIIISIDLIEDSHLKTSQQLVIYSINEHDNLNFIDANNNILISDADLFQSKSAMLFNIYHHWYGEDCVEETFYPFGSAINSNVFYINNNYFQFHNSKIAILDTIPIQASKSLSVNVLYITSKTFFDCSSLPNSYTYDKIILGTNIHWKLKAEIKLQNEMSRKIHDLKEEGAFILHL